jgi:hypothetical protein
MANLIPVIAKSLVRLSWNVDDTCRWLRHASSKNRLGAFRESIRPFLPGDQDVQQ